MASTAPAELAASSHPPQPPRAKPGSSSSGRGGCSHHNWRHHGPRACLGHLRPLTTHPVLQISAIPALLDHLLPLFPAPALLDGLCTTTCWAGTHPSNADIERDCQTGPAPMRAMHGSSREQHFEQPPAQLCFPQELWGVPHTGMLALLPSRTSCVRRGAPGGQGRWKQDLLC